jgi:hypothetical protein
MFTDECVVYLSARSQNVYIWAEQTPYFFEEITQHSPHVMMFAGVTSELIIESYFFEVSVTLESCLQLLSHYLIPEFDNVGLLNSVILQQDRAPAHYAADVCAFLNNQFPLWTEQRRPVFWPPRSPNPTTSCGLL